METSSSRTRLSSREASSLTKVCLDFLQSCGVNSVTPREAIVHICKLLDISSFDKSGYPSLSEPESEPTENIRLTKDQAKAAKESARAKKALRLGVTTREVKLTSQEVKQAKSEARALLVNEYFHSPKGSSSPLQSSSSSGEEDYSPPQSRRVKKERRESVSPARNSPTVRARTVSEKSGSRATHKTKLDNIRRLCLRMSPLSCERPTLLHLIAYENYRNRLEYQWKEYRQLYEPTGILSPIRGLPSARSLSSLRLLYEGTISRLRESSDSPGTYILQDTDGSSFWERDNPSRNCPEFLKRRIPEDALKEIRDFMKSEVAEVY